MQADSRTLGVTNLYQRVDQGMLELTVVSTLGGGEEGGNGTFVPDATQCGSGFSAKVQGLGFQKPDQFRYRGSVPVNACGMGGGLLNGWIVVGQGSSSGGACCC